MSIAKTVKFVDSLRGSVFLGNNVQIEDNVVLWGDVTVEDDVYIGAGTTIFGPTTIGKNTWISPNVSIGMTAEFHKRAPHKEINTDRKIYIGENVIIREFVAVNKPEKESGLTYIGNGCTLFARSHIAHDVCLGDNVLVCTGAIVGGYCQIGKGSYLGLGSIIHQQGVVGAHSIVGAGAVVVADIPPYSKAYGNPARLSGFNVVGLERANIHLEFEFDQMINFIGKKKYQNWLDLFSTHPELEVKLCADENINKFLSVSKRNLAKLLLEK